MNHDDTSEIDLMKASFAGTSEGRLLFPCVLFEFIDSVVDNPNNDDRF